MNSFRLLLSVLLLSAGIFAAPAEDLIVNLPGLNFATNYNQYSGYLDATPNRFLHYWFVESQNNPATDPVVLWLNGGPGCSSLLGFFTELGPFYVDQGGSGELHDNPFSWNKIANVIFLESPVCVGFSYDSTDDCASSDDSTSLQNYLAIQSFYAKFPEYVNNGFFITGESYAGMYIPTLTERIIQGNDTYPINLQAFAIGNGYFDKVANTDSLMFYGYYHEVLGDDLWANLVSSCCINGIGSPDNCHFYQSNDTQCMKYVDQAFLRMYYDGLNPYNLYSDCGDAAPSSQIQIELKYMFGLTEEMTHRRSAPKGSLKATYDPACSDNSPEINYLNDPIVRATLHIPDTVKQWEPCSNIPYTEIYSNVVDKIAAAAAATRALIYNGDVDMMCNVIGNEWDVVGLNLPVIENQRKWVCNGQVAGFVKRYQNLDYLTVKGSGHMVPGYKPRASLQMLNSFLFNLPY